MKKKNAAVQTVTRYEDLPDWLSVPETAKYLRIGRSKAYGMVLVGSLPHRKIGRRIIIPRSAVGPKS